MRLLLAFAVFLSSVGAAVPGRFPSPRFERLTAPEAARQQLLGGAVGETLRWTGRHDESRFSSFEPPDLSGIASPHAFAPPLLRGEQLAPAGTSFGLHRPDRLKAAPRAPPCLLS